MSSAGSHNAAYRFAAAAGRSIARRASNSIVPYAAWVSRGGFNRVTPERVRDVEMGTPEESPVWPGRRRHSDDIDERPRSRARREIPDPPNPHPRDRPDAKRKLAFEVGRAGAKKVRDYGSVVAAWLAHRQARRARMAKPQRLHSMRYKRRVGVRGYKRRTHV